MIIKMYKRNVMSEKEIELSIVGISDLLKPSTSHALILEEKENGEMSKRRMAIIIGDREAEDIRNCMRKRWSPRPMTYDLIVSFLLETDVLIDRAVIYSVNDGVFRSYIAGFRSDSRPLRVEARPSDVFALSIRMHFPVYVLDDLLEQEKIHTVTPDGSGFSMPLNSVNTELLELDLETAIKNEDYERAAMLRDEIARRKS